MEYWQAGHYDPIMQIASSAFRYHYLKAASSAFRYHYLKAASNRPLANNCLQGNFPLTPETPDGVLRGYSPLLFTRTETPLCRSVVEKQQYSGFNFPRQVNYLLATRICNDIPRAAVVRWRVSG